MSFAPQPDTKFKKMKNLKDLQALLFVKKSRDTDTDNDNSNTKRILKMLESDESDNEEGKDKKDNSKVSKKRRILSSDSEHNSKTEEH